MKIKHQDRSSAERRGRELLGAFRVGSRWAFFAEEARALCWVTNEEAAALGDLLALYDDDNGSRCRAYLSWRQHAGARIA
jgi:hypothetical protein